MALRRGNGCLLIDITYDSDPQCMTLEVAKGFYDVVEKYKDDDEFKVNGYEPKIEIYHSACRIDFQYDVDLFGTHLCTVYQSDCVDGSLNFYDVEFRDRIYENSFFIRKIKRKPGIAQMVAARWKVDEEKRKAEDAKRATQESLEFLGSFGRDRVAH